MAQFQRLLVPLKRETRLTTQYVQRRPFCKISPLCAAKGYKLEPSRFKKPARARMPQNETILLHDHLKEKDDVGLLPDTFIMPTGSNCPSIYTLDYWKLLKIRFVQHGKDLFTQLLVYWTWPTKPKPKFRFFATKSIGMGLHKQFYQALAAGGESTIREICTDGLRETSLARIHSRQPGEKFKWELVKEGSSRVVSNRWVHIVPKYCSLRQAVVRIQSTQRLIRYDRNGKVIAQKPAKDLVDYVVIQRKALEGREHPWKIWGTTKETTLEQIEERLRKIDSQWKLQG